MRNWVWPALYPWTCDGSATALSKGEQRSTWERLLKRAATEFSEGGQTRFAEDVRAAALEAGSSTAEAVAAGKEAAEHRRKQTKTPSTLVRCGRRSLHDAGSAVLGAAATQQVLDCRQLWCDVRGDVEARGRAGWRAH